MTLPTTTRHALPLLSAGQAQKELAHNEALLIADFLMNPVVEERARNDPPAAAIDGQAWIIGSAPTGEWAGRAREIACRTPGGWRYAAPFEGLHAWVRSERIWALHDASGWAFGIVSGVALQIAGEQVVGPRAAPIADPSGGTVIDAQGRAVIAAILAALRGHGLIST